MLEIFKTLARSVFGMNHVANHENQYLEIVGNGLDAEHPRNARTLDIAGNEVLAGRLTVGAQPEGDNDVATKKHVDDNAGDELPAVTATENGDVLTVVEGAWAKAAPSGGGAFIVHGEEDVLSGDVVITESFADAVAAVEQDTPVILVFELGIGGTLWLYPNEVALTDDPDSLSQIVFLSVPNVGSSKVSQKQVIWAADESVIYSQIDYPGIG